MEKIFFWTDFLKKQGLYRFFFLIQGLLLCVYLNLQRETEAS